MGTLPLLHSRKLKPAPFPTHPFDKYPLDTMDCACQAQRERGKVGKCSSGCLNDLLEFHRHNRRVRGSLWWERKAVLGRVFKDLEKGPTPCTASHFMHTYHEQAAEAGGRSVF